VTAEAETFGHKATIREIKERSSKFLCNVCPSLKLGHEAAPFCEEIMKPTWPRGSEWRRWDLHLHAPGTKQNDQFKTVGGANIWDVYCRKLHDSDVQAFGIADYFSADGYLSTVEKYKERYPDSEKAFFPNIELRTNDVVNKEQEEVNVHILFNPFRPDHGDRIRGFLNTLKTNKTDSAGRPLRASELKHRNDYAAATTTRAFIQDAIEETYGKRAGLLDCVLIITAANNDGIRAERGKKRKLLITDELDKFSDAFFGSAVNVDYFLQTDRGEDKDEYVKPKPVLSGCDAHSLAEIDDKLGQVAKGADGVVHEPTWIKADLTFEGLKQIIFEPRNRVFIGAEPDVERRVREDKTHYIESLHITSTDGYRSDQHGTWFCDEQIVLGKELVAIIGNKGSGKSAVTDVIGLLGNSHNQSSRNSTERKPEELFSFLNKDKFLKGGCAKHFQGALNWYEGEPDRKLLDVQVATHLPEKVRYLPQKYLERVCANIADDEFRTTLNEVIFRHVRKQDQHGKNSLDDLIKYLTQQAEEGIIQKKYELHLANLAVESIERKLTEDYYKELEEKIRLKKEELAAHATTRPEEKPNPAAAEKTGTAEAVQIQEFTQQITGLAERIEWLEAEQLDATNTAEQLRQVRISIERAATALAGLEQRHSPVLSAAGLSFGQIVSLVVNYTALDFLIVQKEQRLREIGALLLSGDDIAALDLEDEADAASARAAASDASLVCRQAVLESRKAEVVERLGKPAREYQHYLSALNLWMEQEKGLRGEDTNPAADTLKGLEKELDLVNTLYPRHLIAARAERERISREVFLNKRVKCSFFCSFSSSPLRLRLRA
jgi:energy-coupling factor transporter ATP-binding protein EcfA2